MVKEVTQQTFHLDVLESEIPVVLDFWAPWCGPCRSYAPILEEVHKEMVGELVVAKLNIDENPSIASQFQVMSIPTLMLFKSGKNVDTKVGVLPKEKIISWIKSHT